MAEPGYSPSWYSIHLLFRWPSRYPQAGGGRGPLRAESLPAGNLFSYGRNRGEQLGRRTGPGTGRGSGGGGGGTGSQCTSGTGAEYQEKSFMWAQLRVFFRGPISAGKMAAAYIRGIQKKGVYACPKHFAVNSQELRRMAMNAVVDERTLREIYLTAFEIVVKEGKAKALMTSYNQINGSYANENEHLLKEILREEWEYEGMVVTDWGGSNDHVRGVSLRSNLEMPTPGLDSARQLLKAIQEGRLTEEQLDICVDDLLDAVLELTAGSSVKTAEIDWTAHHSLAGRAAAESIVLLKNMADPDPILPLKEDCSVALIGDFAIRPRYQGAGSSMVNPAKEVETMEKMIENYPVHCVGCAAGYKRNGEVDEALKKAALDLAQNADVVIYCFGLNEINEAEGMDRGHMRLPQNQIDFLEALVRVNPNIVGVLSGGSAVEMPWQHCCKAILHGYLGGQAGAGAMMDVLTGRVNPSGRLAETYPIRYEDTPAFRYFPSAERNSEYREGLYIGYRYYDTSRVRVQYPFGFGLSYTSFEYGNLEVREDGIRFCLKNTGSRDGAEVAQLYMGCWDGAVFRPEKELKGFKKVFLKAGETKDVVISFDDKTFRYWNSRTNHWEVEGGTYQILVGACVMDIRLSGSITLKGTTKELPYEGRNLPSYRTGLIQNVAKEEYEILLGYPVPSGKWSGELGFNDAVCQMYYAKSALARWVYKILTDKKAKNEAMGTPDLNLLFQYNIPFRAIAKMTGGLVSMDMIRGILLVINGQFLKGMRQVITGFFVNRRENRRYEAVLTGKGKSWKE